MGYKLHRRWARFWMQFSGLSFRGRLAVRLAELGSPPYKGRRHLARLVAAGYVSSRAAIHHADIHLGQHVFIGDYVDIFQNIRGGAVQIGEKTHIHRDCIIETGENGSVNIGDGTHIQPRCQLSGYVGSLFIGSGVQVAPNCGFYPYNHGILAGCKIKKQQLKSRGDIFIEEDAWLGFGVVVLEKVRIGKGAVVGAGSVVTRDIPDGAVAMGNPAHVVKFRGEEEALPSD